MTRTFLPLILIFCQAAAAQTVVQNISADWKPRDNVRPLRVAGSTASTVFDPAGGNYISARAHDGNRKTKWVAAETPGETAPQWIELKLPREQKISSVAVFGEAIGNDGILDAQIQVASSTQANFTTVAAVTNASSAAWLVGFPQTAALRVRLLVTRSSGPSSHTDVYEVELYGPKLGAEELRQQTEKSLNEGKEMVSHFSANDELWSQPAVAWFGSVKTGADEFKTRFVRLNESFVRWNELAVSEQETLADEMDSAVEQLRQFQATLSKIRDSFQPQVAALKKAREIFSSATKTATDRRAENEISLANDRVFVELNTTDHLWSAFWRAKNDAAIFRAGFAVDVNGKNISAENVSTEVGDFADRFGQGKQILQSWGQEIRVQRLLRIYDGSGALTVSGRIKNMSATEITLDSVRPLVVSGENKSSWQLGDLTSIPASVFIVGASEFQCNPGRRADWGRGDQQSYSSTQMLGLADPQTQRGFVAGFLTALEARPDLNAQFQAGRGGLHFSAQQNFLGRKLGAGQSLDFDPLYICADDDAHAALESYATAASHFSPEPVRTKPTALWCSWYGHRMAIDEQLTLANAAVAAKHLKPLGFEIMQLDHGWQVGDVTGDWIPDKQSFPHGFKWLSQKLKDDFGLKLGVWIAPTDVAETSETFQKHPDWMLQDGQGKPLVNWRWYWKPNPNCYELDASIPEAARWMENVFATLSADGVSYYKIDFIASAGGEQFVQKNKNVTRGWSVLRAAMESVRRGAGAEAWIRYCQPPPLLSAGLADGAYGGGDTLDAGLNGDIRVLRENARSLAASYWINDRLYHREVCDMSVRMQADVEEVRMRLALMTLANCSISFSDELQFLPPSRIRLMQSCLPPGNPPMKPLDLFERALPSIWHIHCKNAADEWDVIGLFNFENTTETRVVDFETLKLPSDADVLASEFWEQTFSVRRGKLSVVMPPQSSRIFSLRRLQERPQIVGTDLHLLQGQHELKRVSWDEKNLRLSGVCERARDLDGKIFVHVPKSFSPHFEFPLNEKSARLTHIEGNIWAYEIHFQDALQEWSIPFDRK